MVRLLAARAQDGVEWQAMRKEACPMTATEALERRIDELCAEVERLRQQVDTAKHTAKRVVVSNHDTDHATGHCACGACGGAIDFWDKWCRHCGAKLGADA